MEREELLHKKKHLLLLLAVVLTLGFLGCGGDNAEKNPDGMKEKNNMETSADSAGTSDSGEAAEVDRGQDAFDLVGMDIQTFLDKYKAAGMIAGYYDKDSMGDSPADFGYALKNGISVDFSDGEILLVHAIYNRRTEYPVPLLKGIGGGDRYESVAAKLGKPYYEGPELTGEGKGQKEFYTAVFYIGYSRYLKVYFDTGAGNEIKSGTGTKRVSYIRCIFDDPPEFQEINGIKIGDSLDDLKAAYEKLYYLTAYYDPSDGGPKYNRLYFTPIGPDNGEECIDFYLYNKKIVKTAYNVHEYMEWRPYEDIFGMKNILKENNVIRDTGTIVYFYDGVDGKEQTLLTIKNCAAEEHDVDGDGMTEIVAYYSVDNKRAVDVYDYDAKTKTILRLDVREALGADWADYVEHWGNVKPEYARFINAGFTDPDGAERNEIYSIKDNALTYIDPWTQDIYQQ